MKNAPASNSRTTLRRGSKVPIPSRGGKGPRAATGRRTIGRRTIAFALDPEDVELDSLSRAIQEALAKHGVTLRQALSNLEEVRQRRFARLYEQR